ncbi:MAG: hypothetical protein KDA80_00520 [Planctomycetaceae bacterium]|nr:hypothetical protein [Planctomycetaceae bacterium]
MRVSSRCTPRVSLGPSSARFGGSKVLDLLVGGCSLCLLITCLGVFLFFRTEVIRNREVEARDTPAGTEDLLVDTVRTPSVPDLPDVKEVDLHQGTISLKGTFGKHDGAIRDVAVMSGDKYAVSGGDDRIVRVWDLESGEGLHSLAGHESAITSVAISPTGEEVASVDAAGVIRIWSRESGKLLAEFTDRHSGSIRVVEFYSLGHVIITGGTDRTVRLTEIESERELHKYGPHPSTVTAARLTYDGRHLISGCEDGSVVVWAVGNEAAPVRSLNRLGGKILDITGSADGGQIHAWADNGAFATWDLGSGGMLQLTRFADLRGEQRLHAAIGSAGITRIAFADEEHVLQIFDTQRKRLDTSEKSLGSDVHAIAFTPTGQFALCGTDNGSLHIWKLPIPSPRELKNLESLREDIEKRGDGLEEFESHMRQGHEAVEDEDAVAANKQFEIARDLAKAGTIEYDIADMAADRTAQFEDDKDRYETLLKDGRDLLAEGEYSAARRKFEQAQKVFPDREEADEGLQRCAKAEKTHRIMTTAELKPTLEFDFRLDGADPLQANTDFAWLYTRDKLAEFEEEARKIRNVLTASNAPQPPMGQLLSPLVWNVRMEMNDEVPEDNLKIRIKLIRSAQNDILATQEFPLKKGQKVFQINGTSDAPEGGWTSGEYYFRKFLVAELTEDEAEDLGKKELEFEDDGPNAFMMGLIRWSKEERDLEPWDVHQSDEHYLLSRTTLAKDDALRIDAEGTIKPAAISFYRKFFQGGFREVVPAPPEGHKYGPNSLAYYQLKMNGAPWAALLYQLETGEDVLWMPYEQGKNCVVVPTAGHVRLSINSVLFERRTLVHPYQQVPKRDGKYWNRRAGAFHVTVWRGEYDFADPVSTKLRHHLLQPFRF